MFALSFPEIAYCCVVIIAAYALRGSTGFGAAAAMPLLAFVVPLKILVPVWTRLGAASSVTIVAKDYRHIAVRELLITLPSGLIGIAIGLYVFTALDTHTLARGLGMLVVAYGCYALWMAMRPPAQAQPAPKMLAPIAGLLGGAVGTTFGTMASVFYAIYFDAIRLPKERFRATMSAMILTLSAARGAGYWAAGAGGEVGNPNSDTQSVSLRAHCHLPGFSKISNGERIKNDKNSGGNDEHDPAGASSRHHQDQPYGQDDRVVRQGRRREGPVSRPGRLLDDQ